jgi:hypothetical protein
MSRTTMCCLFIEANILLLAIGAVAVCGPIDPYIPLTLTDEIEYADVAVIAMLADKPAVPADQGNARKTPKTGFRILEVLKGAENLNDGREIDFLYFGDNPPETRFLLLTTKPDDLQLTPIPLTERSVQYVRRLQELPKGGSERLAFFLDYLEDGEYLLARDAIDEFSRAPYDTIKELTERLHHDKLVAWIKDPEIADSHRRLYLNLLGVCARDDRRADDIAMLEEMMMAEGDARKPALDAIIACYLTFTGGKGLRLVEDRFLKDKDCSYYDTFAAIMALRFHGAAEEIIPRERLLASLRILLDRPDLADLIILDLARWEDWSVMERLVTIFKEADEKTRYVRIPVVQYLQACPLPEAARHLEELAKIDPKAIERASLFPLLGGPKPKSGQRFRRSHSRWVRPFRC